MYIIVEIVGFLIQVLVLAIVARAILSWFMKMGADPLTRLLLNITDPILDPIRSLTMRLLPIPIDISPIVAIILLQVLQNMLARAF